MFNELLFVNIEIYK